MSDHSFPFSVSILFSTSVGYSVWYTHGFWLERKDGWLALAKISRRQRLRYPYPTQGTHDTHLEFLAFFGYNGETCPYGYRGVTRGYTSKGRWGWEGAKEVRASKKQD